MNNVKVTLRGAAGAVATDVRPSKEQQDEKDHRQASDASVDAVSSAGEVEALQKELERVKRSRGEYASARVAAVQKEVAARGAAQEMAALLKEQQAKLSEMAEQRRALQSELAATRQRAAAEVHGAALALTPAPALALSSLSICQSVNAVAFMLPLGASVAGATPRPERALVA